MRYNMQQQQPAAFCQTAAVGCKLLVSPAAGDIVLKSARATTSTSMMSSTVASQTSATENGSGVDGFHVDRTDSNNIQAAADGARWSSYSPIRNLSNVSTGNSNNNNDNIGEDAAVVDDDDDDDDYDLMSSAVIMGGPNDDLETSCITYHEVTLRKKSSDEKIGLTLFYRDMEDGSTDVIVGEIDPSGEAARVGRIQQGDQIVQINGVEVRSRDEVLRLFASNSSSVNLLLSRHHVITQIDDGFDDSADDDNERRLVCGSVTDSQRCLPSLSSLSSFARPPRLPAFMASVRMLECIDEEGDLTDCSVTYRREMEADSGISRTDESTRNDESSEQELNDTDSTSPSSSSAHSRSGCESPGRLLETDDSISRLSVGRSETDLIDVGLPSRFREFYISLDDRISPSTPTRNAAPTAFNSSCSDYKPPLPPRRGSGTRTVPMSCDVDRMRAPLECNQRGSLETRGTPRRVVPRMGTRLNIVQSSCSEQPRQNEVGTDCLAERCRFSPAAVNNNNDNSNSRPLTLQLRSVGVAAAFDSDQSPSPLQMPPPPRVALLNLSGLSPPLQATSNSDICNAASWDCVSRGTQTESRAEAYRLCADVMYTNRANLLHTIAVQQRLFRQQLADSSQSPPERLESTTDGNEAGMQRTADVSHKRINSRVCGTRADGPMETKSSSSSRSEWVVKKRSDGTRYVTRRPTRSRAASNLPALRGGGEVTDRPTRGSETTTTDEEETEQPKTGRYWTREQRRQHVAEKRERDAMKLMKATAAAAAASYDNSKAAPKSRARRALTSELAVVSRHRSELGSRSTQLLSVATV